MRPAASPQRGNIGRESGASGTSSANAGSNPFALMRRMMEDMDRLFSDFGFTTPGMFGSSLLDSGLSPSSGQRSLGAHPSSGGSSLSASQRGQQGLVRGGQSRGVQQGSGFGNLWSPQVEIFERGNNLVVRADLPGLSRENVDVELDEDALIIRGERQSDTEDEDEGFYHSERSYGSFYRAIPLPEGIEPSGCNATFKDGVLEVTLPKPPQQQSRSRRIDVRGG
ncbi:MAG TPA: Hsp20/alpha crystallin family protein [Gemmatimonadaceae bacterium]|nr:Hsp20/alpha crystallin family protein [Gemmatimonadaceae bacterium]